ncbi:MAG TPA: 2-amino-4-hydroxy-6-hydroxymethyldihydropteridine diphosphokinase [Alcanivorax sp.]|nr:2-amino-4-hydroxy-6-hydroxymethyldihydropteridine diphosphokinase [Alcanivorax sp.]
MVVIGLGGNLADPRRQLCRALEALAALPGTRLARHSDLYASAPVGPQDQPDFINAVAVLDTTLAPLALLDALQGLETAAGRERHRHWGERTLDLDILLWDDQVIDLPRLTVPHPQLTQRAFVIGPLVDLLPDCRLPDSTPVADYWPAVAAQPLQRLHCLEEDQFADRTH